MKEYPHIDSVYKRDPKGKFLMGEYSQEAFKYLENNPWVWTEKIDGTNIRIMWRPINPGNGDGEVTFGGKTDNAQIPAKLVTWLNSQFTPSKFFDACLELPLCLYGEGYGAGIQKGGGLYSPEQKFILFDVKIGDWWLLRKDVEDIAIKLGLDVVPIFSDHLTLFQAIEVIKAKTNAVKYSTDMFPNAPLEGLVGQPVVPMFNRKGQRIITKVKVKDFK